MGLCVPLHGAFAVLHWLGRHLLCTVRCRKTYTVIQKISQRLRIQRPLLLIQRVNRFLNAIPEARIPLNLFLPGQGLALLTH
jgi:hypothetical protein